MPTKMHTRTAAVELVLFLVLVVGGSLLMWGSNFGTNMVHNQLSAQRISFPARGSASLSPTEFPGLQQYGGQAVDNGPKAKAYADQFIATHLKAVAGGQTYSQVSAQAQADPTNAALTAKVNTLFKGETLRGLLLYAWGWSVVASIALWVSLAAFAGAAVVLFAMVYGLTRKEEKLVVVATPVSTRLAA